VALAHELPHAKLLATDLSGAALEVAKRNAGRHLVAERIEFLEADLFEMVSHESRVSNHESRLFDLIASNPPYIAQTDAPALATEVRDYEPHAALFGGPTGVEIYARLIEQAGSRLRTGGILVLELGHDSAGAVRKMFHEEHRWANTGITNDLAGIPRVIAAERV